MATANLRHDRDARREYLRNAIIAERMPCIFESGPHHGFPPILKGATIVSIGTVEDRGLLEGGGLVIDFRRDGSSVTERVVLAFNDEAMWVDQLFQTL